MAKEGSYVSTLDDTTNVFNRIRTDFDSVCVILINILTLSRSKCRFADTCRQHVLVYLGTRRFCYGLYQSIGLVQGTDVIKVGIGSRPDDLVYDLVKKVLTTVRE